MPDYAELVEPITSSDRRTGKVWPVWRGLGLGAAGVVLCFLVLKTMDRTPSSVAAGGVPVTTLSSVATGARKQGSTAVKKVVSDGVGGPGAPLGKQVVVGMDTNINFHTNWDDWEGWSKEMEPYWTEDMIYDFNWVGNWTFGPQHGLRAWFDGEHMHFNGALPDTQWMDFIRAATNTTCTSASYGLGRWVAPFAGVPPPASKPWVKIRDLDFYLLEGDRIKINWCIIDVVDLLSQGGYEVLPPAPMGSTGYYAPKAMDGFPAPLSSFVTAEQTAESVSVWTTALKEDYLLNVGFARQWADDVTWYGPGGVGTAHSRQDYYKHFIEPLHAAFSDMEMKTDLLVCEGPYCGAHFYLWGTHTGEWLGEKPTGARVPLRCGAHAHIVGGKIVEGWLIIDIPRAFNAMGVSLFDRAVQKGMVGMK